MTLAEQSGRFCVIHVYATRRPAPNKGEAMSIAKQLRASLLALAVLILAAAPMTAADLDDPGASAPGRDVTVRVMTYNVHAGLDADNRFNLPGIAEVIRASGADIVGLQEVDVHWGARSDSEDEARWLAQELGMTSFFAPIYSLDPLEPGQPRREFGLAILSRYPIIAAENHEITRLSTQTATPTPAPAPGFPEVTINVQGAKVRVYDTHLDFRSDPAVRRMQVDDMLAIIAGDPEPRLLLGDLNAPPDAPELSRLWEEFDDAWRRSGDGAGYTYSATNPVKRIDYILVSPAVPVNSVEVIATLASDHRPVVADITLVRGQ